VSHKNTVIISGTKYCSTHVTNMYLPHFNKLKLQNWNDHQQLVMARLQLHVSNSQFKYASFC